MGTRGVVTAGHYLAAAAGFRIMEQGGNAVDAAAGMCICLNLLEPQSCGIGGEVPTLVYSAKERKTYAISGMGWSPKAFSIDWCRDNGIDLIPGDGYLPITVPAVVDTWALALARFGTMSYSQVLEPAIHIAEHGFPVYEGLHNSLASGQAKYTDLYPTTGQVYYTDGRVPEVGEVLRNPDFAEMLKTMCRTEEAAAGRGRVAGIEAARDAFYKGPIAERIVAFIQDNSVEDASGAAHTGLLSYEDMADWHAELDEPATYNYRGLDVAKCPTWTQGPVFLQQLAILQGYDLRALGHNSPDYLHTLTESAKLAFADREAYYGDPKFDDVPMDVLLSDSYSAGRRDLIGDTASMDMRPGDAGSGIPEYATIPRRRRQPPRPGNRRPRGSRPRPGPRPHGRHHPPGRRRQRGQHGRGHPQRRLDRHLARHRGPRLPHGHPWADVLPQPRPPQRPRPQEAPSSHPHPVTRHPRRRALHGLRHPRRRRPGPVDPPVPAQLRRLRHGPPAGPRRPDRPHHALPLVLLPPRVLPRPPRRREPHPPRRNLRPRVPRPQRHPSPAPGPTAKSSPYSATPTAPPSPAPPPPRAT